MYRITITNIHADDNIYTVLLAMILCDSMQLIVCDMPGLYPAISNDVALP